MRELTANVQQDARRIQIRRLAEVYRGNVDRLVVALLTEHTLSDLAQNLGNGAYIARERPGKVIGRELLAGAGELAMLLADLDAAAAENLREAQRQEVDTCRAGGRDRLPLDLETGPPLGAPRLTALPAGEWER